MPRYVIRYTGGMTFQPATVVENVARDLRFAIGWEPCISTDGVFLSPEVTDFRNLAERFYLRTGVDLNASCVWDVRPIENSLYDYAEFGVDEPCEACDNGGITQAHSCDFENDECPRLCNIDHNADMWNTDYRGRISFPCSNEYWFWCEGCHDWYDFDGVYAPTQIDGSWYCDPSDHGYFACEDCARWESEDRAYYAEYGDGAYCEGCWDEQRNDECDCSDCTYDRDTSNYVAPAITACSTCRVTYIDLMTEVRTCACNIPRTLTTEQIAERYYAPQAA